ncbi:hypothetical protein ACT6QH_05980 [Xanthobacter sp. TB0139]|uniref:hypothetical protein n=1 Tax=Xanthobacter sp. TB0139 TaxID=3459178 RepID=UPI00403A194E
MNTLDSLLIPLSDAGCLNGRQVDSFAETLGARYRFWRDEDGQRHVFSVYPADAAPDYPEAIAIVTRRTPAGSIAMWAGQPGEDAQHAARRLEGDEIHIHVFGARPAPALRRLLQKATQVKSEAPAAEHLKAEHTAALPAVIASHHNLPVPGYACVPPYQGRRAA